MSIFNITAQKDTFIVNSDKNYTSCNSPHLLVGAYGGGKIISYIYFDLSTIPPNLSIKSAMLNLYFANPAYKGRPPSSVILGVLKDGFCDCKTNYRNRPGLLAESQKYLLIPNDFSPVSIDVIDIVKKWHSRKIDNNGFALLPEQFCRNGVFIFKSNDSIDEALYPTLSINTSDPCLELICCTDCFEEKKLVTAEEKFSKTREVWRFSVFSFIVKNTGSKKVLIQLQDSPDGINFVDEEPFFLLRPGQTDIFVNTFFARYGRLKFKLAPRETGSGRIKIWLQGKSDNILHGNIY